ncbi:cytochrome c3 family protein [Seleniivibrio woodruffii]|uniref:cytochrome c3 family protein n=1 Tax=Seleniivibrio woodruffii TaxID=1078050 RepID=UPI0026F04F42|nr:cytochrome c3 family protein [Seleniivibrio woodruffii]
MKTLIFIITLCISGFVIAAQKPACLECHQPADVLPKDHKKVKFQPVTCPACHKGVDIGKTDPFAAGIHLKHSDGVECSVCHEMKGSAPFTVKGGKKGKVTEETDLIKDTMVSWQTSALLDNKHANAQVFCNGCHGRELPVFAAEVSNDVCLVCHGPLEDLQKKTEPMEFKDRNPHKSHLGDVACSMCHHMHTEQTAYCVSCHQKFEMTMPK